MKVSRLRIVLLISGVLALLLLLVGFWPAAETVYQGKPVGTWFKEYAFSTNAVRPTVYSYYSRNGRIVTLQGTPGGALATVTSPSTNRQEQQVWLQAQLRPGPDPALAALRALGPEAVPYLSRQLRVGRLEPIYERVFTNLPRVVQTKIPNPYEKRWRRYRAVDALVALDAPARMAVPALLELLRQPDMALRSRATDALRRIGVDRQAVGDVLLQLGAERRYDEVVTIAFQLGWEGREVARLLGSLLQSPNTALRIRAITLLEVSGRSASPAWEQIIAALKDPEEEVRYLAARSLENIGSDAPLMIVALRASLTDSNVMVSNVTRRILKKIAPATTELREAAEPASSF